MQMDDLDLAWETESTPRRHRRSGRQGARPARAPRRGRGVKTFFALTVSVLMLGLFAGGAWYGMDRFSDLFQAPDYTTAGSGSVEIEILQGQTLADIGVTLQEKDVVKSSKAFTEAAKKDSRSRGIAPGHYSMRLKMRASDALTLLMDPASRVVNKVTIPEGMVSTEIYALLSKKTNIPVEEFTKVAANPEALGLDASWFQRDDGKTSPKSLEGFLFPATYELPRNATATTILSMLVKNFLQMAKKLDFVAVAQGQRQLKPYEALIAASIVQVEVSLPDDMAKAARAMYNRLYGPNWDRRVLEIDSAVNYWWKVSGKGAKGSEKMSNAELHDPKNPYNTHDNKGWTITPISNPGEAALKAALNPDSDPGILYWVTVDKQGRTAFSKTWAEHERNVALAQKNGLA